MSSISTLTPVSQVYAGGPIAPRDLVESGPDGFGWGKDTPDTRQITDYAALGPSSTAPAFNTGALSAQSSFATNGQALLQGPDGSVYLMTGVGAGTTGCAVLRFTSKLAAAPVASVTLQAPGGDMTTPEIRLLSNDTIVCVWVDGASHVVSFAIIDLALNILAARTIVETCVGVNLSSVTFRQALGTSGQGFAIAYVISGGNAVRFASYNNDGTVLSGPSTIQTWGAIGASPAVRMTLLSDGRIGVATQSSSSTAGSLGIWVGVVDQSGGSVGAFANVLATATGLLVAVPSIVAMMGFFAVAGGLIAAGWSIGAFNNAGALQGAPRVAATAEVASLEKALVAQNGVFWFLWCDTAPGSLHLTKIPVTGTLYADIVVVVGTYTGISLRAIGERNLLCGMVQGAIANPGYFVIGLPYPGGRSAPILLAPVVTVVVWGFATGLPTNIPGGDFTFIGAADGGGANGAVIWVIKYAPSSVVGIASGSATAAQIAAARTPVPLLDVIATTQGCNYLGGSSVVAFDHTAAAAPTPIGRKGSLQNNRVSIVA